MEDEAIGPLGVVECAAEVRERVERVLAREISRCEETLSIRRTRFEPRSGLTSAATDTAKGQAVC